MAVHLFRADELKEAQVGYRVSESGESFTGEGDGDWRQEWLVIGYEDLCGDPIFVDLADSDLPVFTAAHGEGVWRPEMIASAFRGFITTTFVERRHQKRERFFTASNRKHPQI